MSAAEADTALVTATLLRLARAEGGRLLALADVEIEVAGVAFVLHGVRVVATGPRSRGVAAPCARVANGRLAAAITLPPEIALAIARVVLDEYEALPPRHHAIATARPSRRGGAPQRLLPA